jgi:hypothetical protein
LFLVLGNASSSCKAAEDCKQEKRGLVRVHKPQVKGTFDPFDEEQTISATSNFGKKRKNTEIKEILT